MVDNGAGIESKNFSSLAQKHHTSKITSFEDLETVLTLGFRGMCRQYFQTVAGEALSSLTAVSDLVIRTKSGNESNGSELEFDHSGTVTKCTKITRSTGTTISVKNIFEKFPVRRQEMNRLKKKEFTKIQHWIQSYALMHTSVRFSFLISSLSRFLLFCN